MRRRTGARDDAGCSAGLLALVCEPPADGKYLDRLRAHHVSAGLRRRTPASSAMLFDQIIAKNPDQQTFGCQSDGDRACNHGAALAGNMGNIVQRHTALTMQFYEHKMGPSSPDSPPNAQELLTLMVGAMGHDIGKIGLDPELLHKVHARGAASFLGNEQELQRDGARLSAEAARYYFPRRSKCRPHPVCRERAQDGWEE